MNNITEKELNKLCQRLSNFKDEIYEILLEHNTINRNFTMQEVVEKIRELSDKAWNFDKYFILEQGEDDD
tara:strand:+ start:707 stop:916 length:210 start_codon:yes stop_codon:yes gene_type:complete